MGKEALGENALLLKRANCASTKNHSNFLAIYSESFLLEVWFEDAISATQREAHIVTELLAFTGEFTACCHNYYFHLLFNNLF